MQVGAAAVPRHREGAPHAAAAAAARHGRRIRPRRVPAPLEAEHHADLPEASGDIPDSVLESLNPEQKAQLARLKEEAVRAREAILSGKPEQP